MQAFNLNDHVLDQQKIFVSVKRMYEIEELFKKEVFPL